MLPETEDSILTRPAEILALRRWEAALFTTYAFSISFFESVVLRELQKVGCRDIWVITDVEGYAASLIERRATKVGRDYRLIPVFAPQGVFHPKCTYLASAKGDMLVVGSGNLTFGGYGRNIEVLDVLIPDVHAEAFLDFSNFLEALGTRPGLGIPDVTWASSFADRSRHASASSSQQISTPSGRLLHSVDRPIVHQIAEICAAKGGAKAMTVLSPFHDRDGSAVLELARVTGCQDIRIGLPPDPKLLSTFPFPIAQGWGLQLKAVRPSVDDAIRRPLHAKWIEIETPTGVFTITGSVNATSAALCSTRNVEVGVVRLTEAVGSKWEDAPIPTEIDQKPFTPGLASGKVSVHASLTGSGEIHGRLIPDSAVEGTWQLTLERLGNILAELPAQVDQSGAFALRLREWSD